MEQGEITQLLLLWSEGDREAADALFPLVYDELPFFAGLSVDETAEALDLAPRTVDRDWQRARAFLHRELRHSAAGTPP